MSKPTDGWDRDEQDLPDGLTRALETLASPAPIPLEVLRAAGADVLPGDLDRAAQRYLDRHPGTRALVGDLDQATRLDADAQSRLFDRITREASAIENLPSSPWRWQIAAAIGAMAIMGTAWWMTAQGGRTPGPTAPATTVAQAPAPTVTPTPPAPPTFLVPLDRPDVRISLRAMTWRGQGPENPVLVALKPALEAFRAGNYPLADKEFSMVAARYPDLIEVALYQGVTRLFLNDVTGALAQLDRARAIDDPAFADDVAWFLAAARERSGDVAGAKRELQSICGRTPSSRACQVLTERR